jgi:hypothetical protein
MSKAAKFKVYTTRVKPVVVYECSMAHDRGGYEKTEYMRQEKIKEDTRTSGTTRTM